MSDVWVLTDGRAGNEGPALALAGALEARGWPAADVVRAAPTAKTALLPAAAWTSWGAKRGGWPFTGYEDPSVFERPWPSLVVSAGRRSAPAAAAMKSLLRGEIRVVQILDPGLAANRFDALVVPEHDGRRGPDVITTLGSLSRVGRMEPPTDGVRRAVALIGGPSRSAGWREQDGRILAARLAALVADGVTVSATASRRTPSSLTAALRATGVEVWAGAGENPYPEMMRGAGMAVVTADSVNMCCEAATAGRPVLVAAVSGLSRKLQRFHQTFEKFGFSRPFEGVWETWAPPELDEAGRVADILVSRYVGGP